MPAFGTEVSILQQIKESGCQIVDTTCGDVMSVWKRVRKYASESATSIIHGKAEHEETKATSSRALGDGNGHYLVVLTLAETDYVCDYIRQGRRQAGIPGEIPRRLFARIRSRPASAHGRRGQPDHDDARRDRGSAAPHREGHRRSRRRGSGRRNFRFFDTICGATQERQDALRELLNVKMDLLLVVGGYNSSNTSHLAEMGEDKLPTYFVLNASRLISDKEILHYNLHEQREVVAHDLAAGRSGRRRHHRRRVLPEQSDRGNAHSTFPDPRDRSGGVERRRRLTSWPELSVERHAGRSKAIVSHSPGQSERCR